MQSTHQKKLQDNQSVLYPLKVTKKGGISAKKDALLVTPDQLHWLQEWNKQLIIAAGDKILEGQVKLNPYRLIEGSKRSTGLDYSDFKDIYQFDNMLDQQRYRQLDPRKAKEDFDKINELMSQRRAPARDAVSKAEVPSAEADGQEKAPKRRGRPPKEQAGPTAEKKSKAAEPRTGRPSKVDKAAREEAPPSVRDKVSRGKKADKGKETGSGGAPASKSAHTVKPGKAAPVKEAAVPPPEIKLPPTPEVPPRPVEEGKIVYLKMSELHPFHTFRECRSSIRSIRSGNTPTRCRTIRRWTIWWGRSRNTAL